LALAVDRLSDILLWGLSVVQQRPKKVPVL